MLAPVLARLDRIPGVTAARVDCSGRFLWLALEGGADAPHVTTLAERVLGNGTRVLSAAQAEAQLAAHRRGDPWLTAKEVMTLSFVESRILSVRRAGEVERQTDATPEQREVIAEAIRSELFVAVERVHAEGGRRSSGWLHEAWPSIGSAAVERCAHAIPPRLGERLAALMPALLTR